MAGLIGSHDILRGNLGARQELKGLWMVEHLEVPEPEVGMTVFYHREAVPLGSPGHRTKAVVWEHRSWQPEALQACVLHPQDCSKPGSSSW